jgi:hypothetical protein
MTQHAAHDVLTGLNAVSVPLQVPLTFGRPKKRILAGPSVGAAFLDAAAICEQWLQDSGGTD